MGLGRTGAPFAIQHWGIEPDFITTAKVHTNYAAILTTILTIYLYGISDKSNVLCVFVSGSLRRLWCACGCGCLRSRM